MKNLIKNFSQFVNESKGSDLTGNQPIQNFGFLSDSQIAELLKNSDSNLEYRMEDFHGEVINAMIDPVLDKIGADPYEEPYLTAYFDINVDLNAGEYTVNGIYDATDGTYATILHSKLEIPELPMTLPLPDLFYQVVDGTIEYGEMPSDTEMEDYRSLAGKHSSNKKDGLSSDEMDRFNKLGGRISAARPNSKTKLDPRLKP